jgi:DNA replication licensing factor MCM3
MKETDVRKNLQSDSNSEKNQVFQKFNRLIHFGVKGQKSKKSKEILTISFIKKYINYAKNEIVPVLTQEASDYIATRYSELRSREDGAQDKYRVIVAILNSRLCLSLLVHWKP